jgi:hypothetical protein
VTRPLPHLPGTLSADQIRVTGQHIADQQLSGGLIPWFRGHHGDPWDHVEAAMALTVCGLDDAADLAFEWSAAHQRPDGSWPMQTAASGICDRRIDSNQCAYLAVGVWHRWLITGNRARVKVMWPVVRTAIELVVSLQLPFGGIAWSCDESGEVSHGALLAGSSSTVMSLRCALALAEVVGDPQPDWELAAARLAHAVAIHPAAFLDKSRYAMDWYYPVLGGAVRGAAGRAHLDRRWDEFVVPGRGARCSPLRQSATAYRPGTCSSPFSTCARTTAASGPGTSGRMRRSGPRSAAPGPPRPSCWRLTRCAGQLREAAFSAATDYPD